MERSFWISEKPLHPLNYPGIEPRNGLEPLFLSCVFRVSENGIYRDRTGHLLRATEMLYQNELRPRNALHFTGNVTRNCKLLLWQKSRYPDLNRDYSSSRKRCHSQVRRYLVNPLLTLQEHTSGD